MLKPDAPSALPEKEKQRQKNAIQRCGSDVMTNKYLNKPNTFYVVMLKHTKKRRKRVSVS